MRRKQSDQADVEKREIIRREFYQSIDANALNLRHGIRKFRKLLGMNQRQFAKYVAVSPRIIMAFEQGVGNPTLSTIEKMLKGSGLELTLRRKLASRNNPAT